MTLGTLFTPDKTKLCDILSQYDHIIWDMDGTIYELDGTNRGFSQSSLHKAVTDNLLRLISLKENISTSESQALLEEISKTSTHFSIVFAQRYNISRSEYFNLVWDIDPNHIIYNFQTATSLIRQLASLSKSQTLITASPSIWQKKVFSFLGISTCFSQVFTAEDYLNKPEIFQKLSSITHSRTLSIGDQLETDINPALECGFDGYKVSSPTDLK